MQNLQGNLGNLTGTAYENRAARLASRLLTRYLRMRRTQVLQAPNADTRPHLDDLINQGVTDGRISDEQAQELERADMIVTTSDAQAAHVAQFTAAVYNDNGKSPTGIVEGVISTLPRLHRSHVVTTVLLPLEVHRPLEFYPSGPGL